MKRAFTAFLVLSLLGGQLGMFGALIGRHHARQQMDDRIPAASESPDEITDAQHLTISRSQLHAPNSSFVRVEEHEFWYQGNLYDIVSQDWQGDVWHVWVVHDREEEQYLEVLAETLNAPTLKESTVPVHHRSLVQVPRALTPTALLSVPDPHLRSQSFPRASLAHHDAPYLAVPHPPPWG
jgi:hypothetical protein